MLQLGFCASLGRAWRFWAARHSQEEASPLGAQPLPWVLELVASKAADSAAFDRSGMQRLTLGLLLERRALLVALPTDDAQASQASASYLLSLDQISSPELERVAGKLHGLKPTLNRALALALTLALTLALALALALALP